MNTVCTLGHFVCMPFHVLDALMGGYEVARHVSPKGSTILARVDTKDGMLVLGPSTRSEVSGGYGKSD